MIFRYVSEKIRRIYRNFIVFLIISILGLGIYYWFVVVQIDRIQSRYYEEIEIELTFQYVSDFTVILPVVNNGTGTAKSFDNLKIGISTPLSSNFDIKLITINSSEYLKISGTCQKCSFTSSHKVEKIRGVDPQYPELDGFGITTINENDSNSQVYLESSNQNNATLKYFFHTEFHNCDVSSDGFFNIHLEQGWNIIRDVWIGVSGCQ